MMIASNLPAMRFPLVRTRILDRRDYTAPRAGAASSLSGRGMLELRNPPVGGGETPRTGGSFMRQWRWVKGAAALALRVYAAPVVDDPAKPGRRPTFNLPFFGGRMGFSGTANGAVPKPALLPS